MKKKVYLYDANGEFNGEYDAQESPLEPGVFLTPVDSTETPPPSPEEGKAIIFNNGGWAKVPEVRGVWYTTAGALIEITDLSAQIDSTWTREPPEIAPENPRLKMEVTAFQAKAALARAGVYENVVNLMDAPETPFEVKLAWEEVLTFKRLSPTVLTLGAALGLDDEALDNLFALAATIDA